MSALNKVFLSPTSLLDSSCYSSEEIREPLGPQWTPSIFDSDPDYIYLNYWNHIMSHSGSTDASVSDESQSDGGQPE